MNFRHIAILSVVSILVAGSSTELHAVPLPNPVISYLFDNSTAPQYGSVTGTLVGSGGSQTSGPTYNTNTPYAYAGNRSLFFDGTDDHVNLATRTVGDALQGVSGATFSAWIQYGTTPLGADAYDNLVFVSRQKSDGASNFWVNLRSTGGGNKIVFGARGSDGDAFLEAVSTNSLSANAWHHIVGVFNYASDTIGIAVDGGTLQTTSAAFILSAYDKGSTTPSPVDSISWSDVPFNNRYWKGYIDEVAIYNTALTQDQINTLFAQGLNPPFVPEPSTLALLTVGGGLALLRRRRSRS